MDNMTPEVPQRPGDGNPVRVITSPVVSTNPRGVQPLIPTVEEVAERVYQRLCRELWVDRERHGWWW